MLPEKARIYPMTALESAPIVMEALLAKRLASDNLWDLRPDSKRFSMREVLAHVADWDPIFLGRLQSTINEDRPQLPDVDEGAVALQNNYPAQDPIANIARWKTNRATLVTFIKSLSSDQFQRTCVKAPLGEISIEGWLSLINGHDMYHLRQAADCIGALDSGKTNNMGRSWDSKSISSPISK